MPAISEQWAQREFMWLGTEKGKLAPLPLPSRFCMGTEKELMITSGIKKRRKDRLKKKKQQQKHPKPILQQCLFWNSDPKMTFSKTLCKLLYIIMTTGMQSMSWHISAGKKPRWHVATDTEVSIQLLLYSCPVLCEKSTRHPPDP